MFIKKYIPIIKQRERTLNFNLQFPQEKQTFITKYVDWTKLSTMAIQYRVDNIYQNKS